MDLLGDLGEESGNQKAARGAGAIGAERGDAAAVLLARLPASLGAREFRGAPSFAGFEGWGFS